MLVARIAGRRTCPKCGKMFNATSNPSRAGDHCDECGTVLVLRRDDSAEVVEERLQVYLQETRPVVDFFKNRKLYFAVDGGKPVDEVYAAVLEIMKREQSSGAVIP